MNPYTRVKFLFDSPRIGDARLDNDNGVGKRWNRSFAVAVFAISAVGLALIGVTVGAQEVRTIHVSGIAELYTAVNDPDNAGRRIVIAPGTYFLDPTEVNGGRLEFQQDMEIVGERDDAEAVVIDAANLPPESYALGGAANTGPVRMGRGSNTLEWLTIQNAHLPAAAAVETDLLGLGTTVVRVAHIVAQGNQRGIDFRNLGVDANGRVLRGIGEDNVLRANTAGLGHGIRVINTAFVTGATVWATLRRNHAYGNLAGLTAVNDHSSGNAILIESREDHFTNNVVGCLLFAGGSTGGPFGGVADSNVLMFEAHGDVIADNDGTPDQNHPFPGGIDAIAGISGVALPNRTSKNLLHLVLDGTRFSSNHPDSDVSAFGAFNADGVLPGTDNHVDILLSGVSRQASLSIADSDPPDPNGTNTVVVFHHRKH